MNRRILYTVFLMLILPVVNACADYAGVQPTASLYYTPYSTLTPITPSATIAPPTLSATVAAPTNTLTLTPEPDIALECVIVNNAGKLYLLSDKMFFSFGPTEEEIDQILANSYPEWANYEQNVPWDTKPVKLGEIVSAASSDDRFNINPAVVLVVLGESLGWQIPPDSDLFLQSQLISEKLADFSFEWMKPENEKLRTQYSEVSNGATYALYALFDYDTERLNKWHDTYRRLFGSDSSQLLLNTLIQSDTTIVEPFLARPFQHPSDSFYTINSFFDHQFPMYEDEGGAYEDTLYRFDGMLLEDAGFDACDPYLGITCYSGHDAYDYNTPLGRDVLAAASGTVINIDPESNTIFIEHNNGLQTYYKHLESVYVDDGASVEQGDVIGESGSKNTGAAHLHFGVRSSNHPWSDMDPFGWWGSIPDPWSEYQTYGQVSTWLWKGDEAGDGYLTVDNRESQAQLFRKPPSDSSPASKWNRLELGYQNEAWYTFLDENAGRDAYWGVWGTTIETPGEYIVQAYWPNDPDFNDNLSPTANAHYTFYYHENGELQEAVLYGNQIIGTNQFNPLCKVPYLDGICPEGQAAKFYLDQGASSVILSNDTAYDPTQNQKILFFDAVRWEYAPTPPTATPTFTSTAMPSYTIHIPVSQGSDDSGTNPAPCDFSATDNEVYFGQCFYENTDIVSGFRFENVQIPRGANIEYAYINFTVDGTYAEPGMVNIYGEASGTPITYSNESPPVNRLTTFNSVSWDITDTWILGAHMGTPNLFPIIQEIITRPDWNTGQPISIIFKNAYPVNVRRVIAFERAETDPSLYPAQLVITYNLNSTPTPTATPTGSTPSPVFTSTPILPTNTFIAPTPVPTDPPPPYCGICDVGCQPSAARLFSSAPNYYGTPTPYAGMPTPTSLSSRTAETINLATLLYRVRDEILSATPEGQRLTDLYYSYIPNIIQVLAAQPEFSDQSMDLLDLFAPSLQALADGNGEMAIIEPEQVAGLQSFLNGLVEYGDPQLQAVISAELERHPLEDMIGMKMDEAWVYFNGYQLEWLPPVSDANPYSAQQGSTIPVKFTVTDFQDNFVIDESLTLQILDFNGVVVAGPIQIGNNPNTGIKIQGSQYHYNFVTKDLSAGLYTLQITYNSQNGVQAETRSIILKKKKQNSLSTKKRLPS